MTPSVVTRSHQARRDSERTIARSQHLLAARRALADPVTMVLRCAWCGRLSLDDDWVPEDEIPSFVGHLLDGRTTHGICRRCTRKLVRDGVSKPID